VAQEIKRDSDSFLGRKRSFAEKRRKKYLIRPGREPTSRESGSNKSARIMKVKGLEEGDCDGKEFDAQTRPEACKTL